MLSELAADLLLAVAPALALAAGEDALATEADFALGAVAELAALEEEDAVFPAVWPSSSQVDSESPEF